MNEQLPTDAEMAAAASASLTAAEMERFCGWLRVQIESGEAICTQLERLGASAKPVLERQRIEIAAATVLLLKLDATESFEAGG